MWFGRGSVGNGRSGELRAGLVLGLGLLAGHGIVTPAWASGPRFISGSGIWVQPGVPEGWARTQLDYFTDPGDLAGSVSHAQADAMVAAAAAVWNVQTSSLSLAQGGVLGEHVSGGNSYFDGSEVVFPADVEPSNESAIPVAVIYDTDGSVTDLLLGAGASEPLECRQNGVTESVDDIQNDGNIHHAVVILNGRCVGTAPEQMTQMQYQLARAFGRVLGLAWSQTNDNVFTAAAPVTADQLAYWPLMHPLDVICGTYTYQCMNNPFTLRVDDLNALADMYPVTTSTPGKRLSSTDAVRTAGSVTFPTGQGMEWVNVVAHRQHAGFSESWDTVSALSGYTFLQGESNPVSQQPGQNTGTGYWMNEGSFLMAAVPVDTMSNVFFTTEAINPLYTGAYALGPYVRPPVTPSGSVQTSVDWSALPGYYQANMTPWDAASSCSPGSDGTESTPAAFDPSGWQGGLLCGWGHSSWWSAAVKAGRTWTLEVTATDESGAATLYKAQPVVGVWNASDPTGTLPTLGGQAVPFNSMSYGMTQVQMAASGTDTAVRFVVSDQYGTGRPDFTYSARMLYADAVAPGTVGSGGGTITITGTGFRRGNLVMVNGVGARVETWTPTQIVAVAPSLDMSGAQVGTPVSVAVVDPGTGGSTSMNGGLSYTNAPDLLQEVSAPAALETGVAATVPFAVRVVASDGLTPVSGAMVSFTVSVGAASLGVCGGASSCTLRTDSNGVAQTSVSGVSTGLVTVIAKELSGGATVQMTVGDTDPARALSFAQPAIYVAAGAGGSWTVQATVTQDGVGVAGVPVTWTVGPGLTAGFASGPTGGDGTAALAVSSAAVASGSVGTITACAWGGVCASWTIHGVDPAQWQVGALSGAGQSVGVATPLSSVELQVTDGMGHPVQGAPVAVYQRVLAWEGPCTEGTRCPAAPVLSASEQNEVSGTAGTVVLTPAQMPGIPQTVQVAASTGTAGFVTLTLVKTP